MSRIAVYCGSSTGARPEYADAAQSLGARLAERGITLVYGGGRVGLMGVLANAVLAGGGAVHGVITETLMDAEIGHQQLTTLDVVATMHERKQRMASLADGFVALPGGFGTLDELFEVLTWTQLGLHRKPVAVVNVGGFFDGLTQFVSRSVQDRFMNPEHGALLQVAASVDDALAALDADTPIPTPKWVN